MTAIIWGLHQQQLGCVEETKTFSTSVSKILEDLAPIYHEIFYFEVNLEDYMDRTL